MLYVYFAFSGGPKQKTKVLLNNILFYLFIYSPFSVKFSL